MNKLEIWHLWFAWYPVQVEPDKVAWLQKIWRKGRHQTYFRGDWWEWEYRLEKPVTDIDLIRSLLP